MAYNVTIYRIETKEREEESTDQNFFEDINNLVVFTEKQKTSLSNQLLEYEYHISRQDDDGNIYFEFEDISDIEAMLTDEALFFSASGEEGIFEISMTASELTDSEEFAKYDPQSDGWEEF